VIMERSCIEAEGRCHDIQQGCIEQGLLEAKLLPHYQTRKKQYAIFGPIFDH